MLKSSFELLFDAFFPQLCLFIHFYLIGAHDSRVPLGQAD